MLACAWDGKGQWIETQGETFPMRARCEASPARRTSLRGWVERNVALPTEIWIACKDVAGAVLSENVSVARALIEQASETFDKVNALELLALLAPFVPGSELRQTAIRVANDEVTARSLELLACIVDGHEEPLSVIPNPEPDGEAGGAPWNRQLVDPAIVEVLLGYGDGAMFEAGTTKIVANVCQHGFDPVEKLGKQLIIDLSAWDEGAKRLE